MVFKTSSARGWEASAQEFGSRRPGSNPNITQGFFYVCYYVLFYLVFTLFVKQNFFVITIVIPLGNAYLF